MPDSTRADRGGQAPAVDVGTDTPHPARMYDYYLGGKDNFEADRIAAEKAMSVVPDARTVARTNREFLVRAVRAMAASGIDQFIDLGAGFPTSPNVHEVARELHPGARVIFVDNDPVVVTHNQALRKGTGVSAIYGDVRDPDAILRDPVLTKTIDFTRPVGVLCVAVLHFVSDAAGPRDILRTFRSSMAPGSMLAISHLTSDGMQPEVVRTIREAYANATAEIVFRSAGEIEAMFGDLRLLEPGVVQVQRWRPELRTTQVASTLRWLGGVARVP
jgi:O-methyltransferase involved in polyketide biosynthesis